MKDFSGRIVADLRPKCYFWINLQRLHRYHW